MKAREIFEESTYNGEPLQGNESQVRQVPGVSAPRRAWLGIDVENRAVAYFEIEPGETAHFTVSQAIGVQTLDVKDPSTSNEVRAVKLTCYESKLGSVFYSFVDELLERIRDGQEALRVINSAAVEWRSLLLAARSPLTEHTAAGLYGELRFLEAAVAAIGPSALGLWQRSAKEIHDFIADGARVEVKTSAFQNRAAVTIHGLKQLQTPPDATLTLAVAEIQRHGGELIDDVVERILSAGAERDVLTQKLLDAAYVVGMPGASEYSFTLLSWRYWEILPTSNVLSRSTIPVVLADAISSLSYTLDLSSLGSAQSDFDHYRLISMNRSAP